MARGLLRPTFELRVGDDPRAVGARLKSTLEAEPGAFESRWARGEMHVIVAPARTRRHVWSAWLHLDLRTPDEGQGTLLFGRFTPNPGVWTAYMLTLIALLAIALFALALTLAQMTLERPTWGLWLLAGSVGVACTLVYGSICAQGKALTEMDEMRAIVQRAIGKHPEKG
jgi:hypothetical protein